MPESSSCAPVHAPGKNHYKSQASVALSTAAPVKEIGSPTSSWACWVAVPAWRRCGEYASGEWGSSDSHQRSEASSVCKQCRGNRILDVLRCLHLSMTIFLVCLVCDHLHTAPGREEENICFCECEDRDSALVHRPLWMAVGDQSHISLRIPLTAPICTHSSGPSIQHWIHFFLFRWRPPNLSPCGPRPPL